MNIRPFDELSEYELEADLNDPTQFTVIGAADFVFGRVRRLLVDLDTNEVVYLVVNNTNEPGSHEVNVEHQIETPDIEVPAIDRSAPAAPQESPVEPVVPQTPVESGRE